MGMGRWLLLAWELSTLLTPVQTLHPPLGRRFFEPSAGVSFAAEDACAGSLCLGLAQYPASPGVHFYAEFDVPGLPEDARGVTEYIYFNIFFGNSQHGVYNQFVPQLYLGDVFIGSTGPPRWDPVTRHVDSWKFGSMYFFGISNTSTSKTELHEATGEIFDTRQGEVLWTRFELSADWVWSLSIGVKGDPNRTSVALAPRPYMGLLGSESSSWFESRYRTANVNSCWELDGMRSRQTYPSTGSSYVMQVTADWPGSVAWDTNWYVFEQPTCPGHPLSEVREAHNGTVQVVAWDIYFSADESDWVGFRGRLPGLLV